MAIKPRLRLRLNHARSSRWVTGPGALHFSKLCEEAGTCPTMDEMESALPMGFNNPICWNIRGPTDHLRQIALARLNVVVRFRQGRRTPTVWCGSDDVRGAAFRHGLCASSDTWVQGRSAMGWRAAPSKTRAKDLGTFCRFSSTTSRNYTAPS